MSRRRNLARAAGGMLTTTLLVSACGAGAATDEAVHWYVSDADLGAEVLASTCDVGAEVVVHELPDDTNDAYAQLVRRLQSDPASVDLLAVDAALIPELAGAGFVRELSASESQEASTDVLPAAAEQVTVDGAMYAVPWLFDPQLLWFRGVTAERAGLDTTQPINWDDLIAGADRLGVTVQVDDGNGTGLAEWVTGLVASAGGQVVDGKSSDSNVGLSSDAGRAAASVIEFYRESQVGPGPVGDAVEAFAGNGGGFLIAPGSAWSDPAIAALGNEVDTVGYPRLGSEPFAPASGIALAVSEGSEKSAQTRALIDCLTADQALKALVIASGHGTAKQSILADEIVQRDLQIADTIAGSMSAAQTVPVTPYWDRIRRAIDDTWIPGGVTVDGTPRESQRAVEAAMRGELP